MCRLRERPNGGWGKGWRREKRRSKGNNTRWGQSQTVGQTDQRKGGMGGRRVPGALNSPKQTQEAPSWGLAAQIWQNEGGEDTGVKTRDSPWLGAGSRPTLGRAGPGAPPPPSRRSRLAGSG